MNRTAAALALPAVFFFAGCQNAPAPKAPPAPAQPTVAGPEWLVPSPRLIVGRVLAVDAARGFAMVELLRDAPAVSTAADTELYTRTAELQATAVLQASRYLRGRTLGTVILSGRPNVGDEVVWQTP